MSSPPASDRAAASGGGLELWAARSAVRRSRLIGYLLTVNWLLLGWVMYRAGIRTLVGALAFGFGLLALIGGLSQLRAVRRARTEPLIRLRDDVLESRSYTGPFAERVHLDRVDSIVDSDTATLRLRARSGEEVEVPWLALSEGDRERLVAWVRARI